MSALKLAAVALMGLSLAACAGSRDGIEPGPKENTGTLLGRLIGNRISAALDDEDRERAYTAQMDALERGQSGAPVPWRNPDSGRYGTVVPGPVYVENDRNCRSYTHTIFIDGRPQTARGSACRNPDGSWTALS